MADPPPGLGGDRGHLDATGDREVVFCHRCEREWYRDEHGLICPDCEDDAVEIVSTPPSPHTLPEDTNPNAQVSAGNDPRPIIAPPITSDDLRALHNHHPWLNHGGDSDPEEDDIDDFMTTGSGGRTFRSSRTLHGDDARDARDAGAQAHPNDPSGVMGDFQRMFGTFMGPGFRGGQAGRAGADAPFGRREEDPFNFPFPPLGPNIAPRGAGINFTSGTTANGGTFTYQTFTYPPRNPTGQQQPEGQARGQQPDELATYEPPPNPPGDNARGVLIINIIGHPNAVGRLLNGLFGGMLGGQMGNADNQQRGQQGGVPQGFQGLQGFLQTLLNPANAVAGDAVYSQEALDRIISTLMEQHPTSNAPGPASQEAIDSLPKKKVDEKMLGAEGKAECSVCMDDVALGDEVVVLPCKHWFHEQCATAWLKEHNTCPICRTGISPTGEAVSAPPAEPIPNETSARGPDVEPTRRLHRMSLPGRSNSNRNESRLDAIRNVGARLDSTPESSSQSSSPRRIHVIGTTSSMSPPAQPPLPPQEEGITTQSVPGAFEASSRSPYQRRGSDMSDVQMSGQSGRRTSGSDRSRRSMNSEGSGESIGNGPRSWFRRLGGGGGR